MLKRTKPFACSYRESRQVCGDSIGNSEVGIDPPPGSRWRVLQNSGHRVGKQKLHEGWELVARHFVDAIASIEFDNEGEGRLLLDGIDLWTQAKDNLADKTISVASMGVSSATKGAADIAPAVLSFFEFA